MRFSPPQSREADSANFDQGLSIGFKALRCGEWRFSLACIHGVPSCPEIGQKNIQISLTIVKCSQKRISSSYVLSKAFNNSDKTRHTNFDALNHVDASINSDYFSNFIQRRKPLVCAYMRRSECSNNACEFVCLVESLLRELANRVRRT